MIDRCEEPLHPSFKWYGGRGISVSPEWRGEGGFVAFQAHVGPPPTVERSIDRIDNDGNYEPGNVRWSTEAAQHRNRSDNHLVTFDGRTQCLTGWAREYGLKLTTLWRRLRRGWTTADALTTPVLAPSEVSRRAAAAREARRSRRAA